MDSDANVFTLPSPATVASKSVVVCSCFSAGFLSEGLYLNLPELQSFDYVIVDEAGQVDELFLIMKATLSVWQSHHSFVSFLRVFLFRPPFLSC